MPRARLVWSQTAFRHFQAWILHIAKDSIQAAERERKALIRSVRRLKTFPASGRMVPEFGNPTLREIVRRPIRVIYRLKGNEVRILTFHHSSRELDFGLFT